MELPENKTSAIRQDQSLTANNAPGHRNRPLLVFAFAQARSDFCTTGEVKPPLLRLR